MIYIISFFFFLINFCDYLQSWKIFCYAQNFNDYMLYHFFFKFLNKYFLFIMPYIVAS